MRTGIRRTDGGGWWLLLLGTPVALLAAVLVLLALGLVGAVGTSTANANSQGGGGACAPNPTAPVSRTGSALGAAASTSVTGAPTLADDETAAVRSAVAAATSAPLPASAQAKVAAVDGYSLSAAQVQSAQLIVAVAKGLRLDQRAMRTALVVSYDAVVLVPSPLVYDRGGETAGLFGQWVSDYPGVNLIDPVQSATSFYEHMRGMAAYQDPARQVGEVAAAATAPHGRPAAVYRPREAWAAAVVGLLATGDTPVSDTGGTGTGIDCITGATTGPVPGLTPAQATNASIIVQVAAARHLPTVAAQIGVAVAIAEATLLNYANDGSSTDRGYFPDGHRQLNPQERSVAAQSMSFPHDAVGHNLDSIGLFQQRPSAGWGTPTELIAPAVSAGKFYDALDRVAGWQSMDPWVAAQTVQGSPSSDGGIYQAAYNQAKGIVAALTTPAPGGGQGGSGVVVVNGPAITLPAKAGVAGTITAPNTTVAKAISAGLSWLGEPYSWGGGSPNGPTLGICGPDGAENDCHIVGFDCSGLMQYMWAQVGITLDHFSQDQWAAGQQIPYAQAVPGDMLADPGHIAMYLGKIGGVDYLLEAPQSGDVVHLKPVYGGFYPTLSRVWADTP
ncbi:C40 family peptidase [Nakamurella endophytica]|uniref:NlpC/P60 domain-containing protein n=1 Tax=Nakamurella endophytica TaxID=1748367 RepID=A0A917WMQ3_9ACTN|nr:NlpC/P60 family protein [Nakamurella endophytica]GGM15877.1 hypothetical protein GCM10011594_39900 [Nakamurella endophytica]